VRVVEWLKLAKNADFWGIKRIIRNKK